MSASSAPPRVHVAPRAADTYGDLASDLAGDYGLVPDDWQQLILDDWLAVTRGRWASLKCGLSVPRQNGKNGALEVRELFGMVGRGEKILHTAHQVKTAQKHFRRLKHFFGKKADDPTAKFPELNALVSELRNVNGQEAIYLKNGGSVEIVARSQGSGRGFTVDVIVCDEAQDMSDDDLEALLSTSSAGPLGDPQWIFTGTPPGPKANGEVFTRNRTEALGLVGKRPAKVCWHEWSADEGDDLDSVETWKRANPGIVNGRLLLDVIEGERTTFSDGGFKRERLGMWPDPRQSRGVIPADVWAGRKVDADEVPDGDVAAYGLDMSHDRVVSIGVCVDEHVEVAALDQVSDTLGAVEWLVERAGKRVPVVVDGQSPAASMVSALKAGGVKVVVTSAADMAKACGGFYDAVMESRLTHFDQPPLNAALAGARKRPIGTAGGWGWDRKDYSINLAPLVSVTLARFGASAAPSAKKPSAAFAF